MRRGVAGAAGGGELVGSAARGAASPFGDGRAGTSLVVCPATWGRGDDAGRFGEGEIYPPEWLRVRNTFVA